MFVKKILFSKIKFDSSVVTGIVSEAEHYLHSSARDYLMGKLHLSGLQQTKTQPSGRHGTS